ncbi:VanZ family protein [Lentibacillus sp. N15]|uniref:VanZ family protein n=1 Tax=Lentibacillus songyuanensis TaxID=3136161 RepID=UPI0031BA1229
MARFLFWAAVVVWMAIIFYLSHEPASDSNELSTGVLDAVVSVVEKVAPHSEFNMVEFHHIIRKCAHFLAYLLLGMLVFHALRRSGMYGYRITLIALLTSVLYASTDEVHQLFVPGRSGEIRDVLIDSAGACVGIGMALLVVRRLKRRK